MCKIGALVSVWKASTADLMVSRENVTTQVTSNASNAFERFVLFFSVNRCKIFFWEITLIIQINKLTATVFWKCKLFGK